MSSGHILLRILQSVDADPLHSVKWHPKQADTLAVSSETKMYLFDLADAARTFRAPQVGLDRISQVFSIPRKRISPLSPSHLLMHSRSTWLRLALTSILDGHSVSAETMPSSLTFIDVIGRKNGTVLRLLSVITNFERSFHFRFVNGSKEDPEMFGHINYDSRIHTLWVANHHRDSLVALKIDFDVSASLSGELLWGDFFEQVVELSGSKPTIHFVILRGC